MIFTYDDRKRLKDRKLAGWNRPQIEWEEFEALLSRLEAAEDVCGEIKAIHPALDFAPDCEICRKVEVWKKAAGQ